MLAGGGRTGAVARRAGVSVAASVVAGGGLVLAAAGPAAAHGVGGRADLPVPVWLAAYAAGAALVISFVALGILWPRPRLSRAATGTAMPPWTRIALRVLVVLGRLTGLVLFSATLAAAAFGPTNPAANLAPVMVYVIFWVGMQAASAVFGGVWQVLSPFDTLALVGQRVMTAVSGRPRLDGLLAPAASDFSHWPAAAGILAFSWLELAYHEPDSPRVLATALAGYGVVMLAGAARWGRAWLRTGDGFAAWFGLLAHMSPFTRDRHGTPRLRPPFTGLAEVNPRPGTVGLILVVLGSTAFDGLSRTTFWLDVAGGTAGWERTGYHTLGLVWSIGVMTLLYVASMQVAQRVTGRPAAELVTAFVHSLVPIALAYVVAHYFSLFVFEGQQAIALASDPLGRGWDLFGTIDQAVDYQTVSTATIAYVQVGAIVIGHMLGVTAAHDRAVELFPRRQAVRSQYPLLAVMVLYTVGGLALMLGA